MAGTGGLILTEGGSGIGMGHITRCLSFYAGLLEAGESAELVINCDAATAKNLEKYRTEHINLRIYDWNNSGRAEKLVADAGIVIVDSYQAPRAVYETICASVKRAVFLDDYNRLDYPGGFVVNGALCAADIGYPAAGKTKYLLGPAYQPLRNEFWDLPATDVKNDIENILITFGGDDLRNLTPGVLKRVCADFPDLKKLVIIGGSSKNAAETEKNADNNTVFYRDIGAAKMLEIMLNSDIAITAAGQTTYELARTGVPAIVVRTAENQRYNITGLMNAGVIEFSGDFSAIDIAGNISEKLKTLAAGAEARRQMSENGKRLIDGQGVRRILNEVLKSNRE